MPRNLISQRGCPAIIPQNKRNQLPQKTTKPSRIPSFGFEAIGGIAIAALITVITRRGGEGKEEKYEDF